MKERWFNYRPICLVFLFLLLGSVFSFYLPQNIPITLIIVGIVIIFFTIIAIYKKKPQYLFVPIIAFIIGVSLYNIALTRFNNSINYIPNTIQARIYDITKETNDMLRVEADNCIFDNKKCNDNIVIYIYDDYGAYENIEIGSIIEFSPYKFYKSDLVYNKIPNSKLYTNDLKYTASVLMEDVTYIKTDKTFAETIKDKIKDNLSIGLTNENAEIAYSALFGDKDLLSDKQYDIYKLSGVAHLLAVSGLHVGIIVKILQFFLSFRKSRKWWKVFVISLMLLFYMYLCGFSISIVRASVMSIIALFATVLGKEYDPLNSISVAGIIIFIANPFCMFDATFLLSFSCILGITMLYSPIEKVLLKIKTPNSLTKSLSMSISTTLSIIFIMAYYFRNLNIISIFANIILIPIFSVAFSIVFVVAILSLIIPKLTLLLYPINYVFSFINILANSFTMLPFANFYTTTFNYLTLLIYFCLLLFAGRFSTAKYQYKLISTIPILALLVCCLL